MITPVFIVVTLTAMVTIKSTEGEIVLEVLLKNVQAPQRSPVPQDEALQHSRQNCAHNMRLRLYQGYDLHEWQFFGHQFTYSSVIVFPEFLNERITNPISMLLKPNTESQSILLEVVSTNERRPTCLPNSRFQKKVMPSVPVPQIPAQSPWQPLKIGAVQTNLTHRPELVVFLRWYCSKGTYGSSCQNSFNCQMEGNKCLADAVNENVSLGWLASLPEGKGYLRPRYPNLECPRDPCIIVDTNPLVHLDQTSIREGFQTLLTLRLAKLNMKVVRHEDIICTTYVDILEFKNQNQGLAISVEAHYREMPISPELVFQALVDMLLSNWLHPNGSLEVTSGRKQGTYPNSPCSRMQHSIAYKAGQVKIDGDSRQIAPRSSYFLMGAFWFIVGLAVILSVTLARLVHKQRHKRFSVKDHMHQAMIDTDMQTTFTEY